jgi:RNA polymerase sigma factor (sigma-70 family)
MPGVLPVSPRISVRLLATQPDQRLQELAGRGYERAFEAIVNRYRQPLLAYCHRLGLRDGRAEDVVQHALLNAWLALRSGAQVHELRPWLYRIVHNTAVNAIRSAPGRRVTPLDVSALESAVAAPAIEHHLAVREALTDVAALPQMQREALLMSAVHGRSHAEVAGELGISSGAVRGLLYRARTTLRGAAAVLVPGPLLRWASHGGEIAPTASGIAQLPGGSPGQLGQVLVKGAALAVSAALAAGAVLVPSHHHPGARDSHATGDSDSTAAKAVLAVTAGLPAAPASRTAAGERTSTAAARGLATVTVRGPLAGTRIDTPSLGEPRGVTSPGTAPSAPAPAGSPVGGGAQPVAAHTPGEGGATAASGGGHTPEAPAAGNPQPPAGTGIEAPPGGTTGGSKEAEPPPGGSGPTQAEREAEEARERAEAEAEATHEREREEAEERREHEVVTTREPGHDE